MTAPLRTAVIFDVDGTLCDVRTIRHLIATKGFDAFHRASIDCPPHAHVVHAWDDNPAVLRLWAEEDIPTTVVPGWDGAV